MRRVESAMRLSVLGMLVVVMLAALSRPADACACCGAYYTRTPVGWTQAGGAILVEAADNVACDATHRLEIWRVGVKEPAGCFDLLGDPEKRVACTDLTVGVPKQKAKRSTRVSLFPVKPVPLDVAKVRVDHKWQNKRGERREKVRVTVSVDVDGRWRRVWTSTIEAIERGRKSPVDITVWPNARGDRALLLASYTHFGDGNDAVKAHWVKLR